MTTITRFRFHDRRRERGQGLVEFAIVLIPFVILLMGILDLGRAIYIMNGTSEAAREIARVTSVHLKSAAGDVGMSTDTQAVIATQRTLIPGLLVTPATDIVCVDETDAAIDDAECGKSAVQDQWIRVHVQASFSPFTPIVSSFGSHTIESYSRIKLP